MNIAVSEQHARLSPSNKSWPYCPASVKACEPYPDIPGDAAIDGTGSHLLLEMCLQNGVPASHYDGEIIGYDHHDKPNGWMITNDRIIRVQMCLDYIATRVKQLKTMFPGSEVKVYSESKANPGGLIGRTDWWGTCDVTITVTNLHGKCLYLETCDYKDGREWVAVEENTQLQSYTYGKMRPYIGSGPDLVRPFHPERVAQVRMTIVQPKTNPPVRFADMTGVEAFASFEALAAAARETDLPDAPFRPDDKGGKGHCRWCKHGRAGNCEALNNSILNTASVQIAAQGETSIFGLMTLKEIKSLPDDKLTELYDKQPAVMQVFTHIAEELQARVIERGVDGFAMEPGRGSRVWALKEDELVKALKAKRLGMNEIYVSSLISPAQCLKLEKLSDAQKKNIESELIVFKSGEKKLTRKAFEKKVLSPAELFAGAGEVSFLEVTTIEEEVSFLDTPTEIDPNTESFFDAVVNEAEANFLNAPDDDISFM